MRLKNFGVSYVGRVSDRDRFDTWKNFVGELRTVWRDLDFVNL
jgi:hypothetical protein